MMESRCNTVYNCTAFNGFRECGSKFTLRLNTAKVPIILKNALDKSSLKLNFLHEKQWTHISVSPSCGARGLQRLAFPF